MLHIIYHTLLDTLKIVPFLLMAFLLIEFIEHKLTKKNHKILTKSRRYAPLFGSLLGMIPQCGFSALATNLFSSRVVTIGTLISVYLSTSDEMLPILLSGGMPLIEVLEILLIKAFIGFSCGVVIDLFIRSKKDDKKIIKEMCHEEECHCNKGIIKASIKHTLSIALYLFIASLIINVLVHYIGEDKIGKFLLQGNILSYFIASLIGLIPNCASSVIISELYLSEVISLGNMFSGLLTGNGIGILLLFKTNKNISENLKIVGLIYGIGVIAGLIIDLLGIVL